MATEEPTLYTPNPSLSLFRERQEAEAHSRAHKGTALAAEEAAERRREAEARRKEELAAKVEAKALRKELAQVWLGKCGNVRGGGGFQPGLRRRVKALRKELDGPGGMDGVRGGGGAV